MKRITFFAFLTLYFNYSFGQLTVTKKQGGSVVTKIGFDLKLNDGSSLKREYTTINDSSCPVQLSDVGIETSHGSSSYTFRPIGSLTTKEPIVAYEIVHLIYSVFGDHLKSLSYTEITDIEGERDLSRFSNWYASENNVSEYLICISYVSNVRTQSGKLWHYNFKALRDQLDKLQIKFEESYVLKLDGEKTNIY